MKNYHSWFFAAIAAGAGAYFIVDANESVRNLLSVLAFCVVAFYGEKEIDNKELKESNKRLCEELQELQSKLDRIELEQRP